MSVTRLLWYAGTVLTALAMLAASATATSAAQGQARAVHAGGGRAAVDSWRPSGEKRRISRGFVGSRRN